MNYKKILEDNKPLLTSEIFPFLEKFQKSQKLFILLLLIGIITIVSAIFHMISEDKKTVNKILLARESTLNTAITKLENKNDILEAEILLLKNKVKFLSRKKDMKKHAKISKYLADSEISGNYVKWVYNVKVDDVDSYKAYKTEGYNAYGKVSLLVGFTDTEDGYVFAGLSVVSNEQSYASTLTAQYLEPLNEGTRDLDDVSCGATYGAKLVRDMIKEATEVANK